jgi:hypothetical protein
MSFISAEVSFTILTFSGNRLECAIHSPPIDYGQNIYISIPNTVFGVTEILSIPLTFLGDRHRTASIFKRVFRRVFVVAIFSPVFMQADKQLICLTQFTMPFRPQLLVPWLRNILHLDTVVSVPGTQQFYSVIISIHRIKIVDPTGFNSR